MSKKLLIDNVGGNSIGALVKGKKLIEYHVEKCHKQQIVGSIFKGVVKNVLSGMQAAFVDIGLDKNGYLSVSDTLVDKTELKDAEIPNILDLKEGDEIMVQAVKDPVGNKGTRLTMHISLAGKNIVYMPAINISSISRKIENLNERVRLQEILNKISKKGGGFIARTASENSTYNEIKGEAKKLIEHYKEIVQKYKNSAVGDVLYSDGDLSMRLIRDVYTKDVEKIIVADYDIYTRLKNLPKSYDDVRKKVEFFDEKKDLMSYYELTEEVDSLLRNKVMLDSGAYLIIDKTEALTVIDVNTGGFVGDVTLEDTVFKTNILASNEIARQVRLRNIGGIVVVDFIDMQDENHRKLLLENLENELKKDRIKCNVIGMTGLGLVEFTRKKKRKDISSIFNKNCPYCHGEGKILSNEYIVMKIRTSLFELFAENFKSAIVDLNVEICDYIINSGALANDVKKYWKNKRIYFVPHKTYHQEFFISKGDNSKILDLPDKAVLLH